MNDQFHKQVYPDKFQNYFLDIIIRCEKQKEGSYSRTYKNFNNIMSEIGGFTQSFLAIGYLICSRLSQLQLNQNLINQAFNYEDSNEEQKKNFERKSILQQKVELLNQSQMSPSVKNSILKQPENFTSPDNVNRTKKRSQFIQNCQSSKLISDLQFDPSQSQQQPHNQDQKNYSIDNSRYKKELENVDSPKRAKRNDSQKNISSKKSDKKKILNMMIHDELEVEENSPGGKNEGILDQSAQIKLQKQKLKVKQMEQKLKEDRFKQLMDQETKCMKMSIWEYFKSKIYPFGALKQKKQVIEYSIDKLYYNLDIFNILKKLTEVEKLKRLILDHEQLKLFDYLPKPTIHSDLVLNKNQGQEQNRKAYETDILYQDHRTEMKKVKDAFHAYKKIVGKQNHSFLDQRIIDLLDPNLVSIFQAQGGSFEYNMPIQKQSTDEMFEQSRRYKFNQFQTRVKTEQIRLYNLQTETQQQNLITKLDQVIEKQQSTNPVSPLDQSPPLINDSFPFLLNLQSLEQRQIKNLANQNQEQVSKNNSNQILEDQMKDLAQSIYNDVAIEQYQEIPNQFQRNVKCYNDQDQ